MKRMIVLLLSILLILTSCVDANRDSRIYDVYVAKIKSDDSEKSELSRTAKFVGEMSKSTRSYKASDDAVITRTLTIIGAIPDYSVEGNIQSFVNAHSDVEIVFEQYKEQSDFFDVFPVLLMTKDYGDIVILQSGDLDPKKVNETSFEDLYPFVDHEDFEKNNYYMNFLHAVSREGKLFVIPATIFTDNLFMMRTDIAPEYVNRFMSKEDFNYNDLVEIYLEIASETRERGEEWNILLEANFDPMQFLIHNLDSLIDFEKKTAKFTDPEFMALMERVKNEVYYGDYITYSEDGITYSNYYKIHDFLDLNKCVEENTRELFSDASEILLMSTPMKDRQFTVPRLVPTATGNYYFHTDIGLTISRYSQNKELAWEFIKYFMADKEIPDIEASDEYVTSFKKWLRYARSTGGFWTVNKTNQERMQSLERDYRKEELKKDYRKLSLEQDYNQYYKDWYLPFVRQVMGKYNKTYSEIDGLFRYNHRGILWDDMYLYLTDKQTVEQTMQNIENKVNIWLNE